MINLIYDKSWHGFYENIKGDLKYAALLLFCLVLSILFRFYVRPSIRVQIDGIVGLLINIYVSGYAVLYSLILVIAHLILYRLQEDPREWGQVSFIVTFLYLGLLRIIYWFGLPRLEFITNAIQLIMTLRVIGFSYEMSDSKTGAITAVRPFNDEMTSFKAFNYLYSYTGIFTGPYYSYRTYHDAYSAGFNVHNVNVWELIKPKLRTLMWSLPLLVVMSYFAPVKILQMEESGDYHVLHLFFLSALAFIYLRMRIYSAWMVSESICAISGIGIYPTNQRSEPGAGPKRELDTNEQVTAYDTATIDNLDIPNVENSNGFRSGMRAWNRTVQFWLANFVYKRSAKSIRMPYTMFVSAFWHGVHPGYFMSFLTIPLCTAAEDILFKHFPADASGSRNRIFDLVWRFIRMRGFEMMACGFLLLTWTDTYRLWKNTYFWLHFLSVAIILLKTAGVFRNNRKHETTAPESHTKVE
ncbi:Lysophospholipid acyltransferase 7 [Aphelenchoides besseyi]|nr:Lysophospholipid acyltransferase 7 [Aphelenchoides besseyi]KAI6202598.1 Lysophospholipid acyltransferase 7 [Aphelenchoides besseyi]